MGFLTGQYVNTQDGLTAYIYGQNDESLTYQIAICDHDEERSASASELTLYTGVEPVWD